MASMLPPTLVSSTSHLGLTDPACGLLDRVESLRRDGRYSRDTGVASGLKPPIRGSTIEGLVTEE